MSFDGSRAELYRQQAQRLRAKAASYTVEEIRIELEEVAAQWDRIADQVARGIIQP